LPKKTARADTRMLLVSRMCMNFGDRAFIAAGPCVCNNLQTDPCHAVILDIH